MIDQLKENFQKLERHLNGASSSNWHQLRKEAFTSFEKTGFPKAKDEEYRYTQIGRVLEKNFDFSNLWNNADSQVRTGKPLFHDSEALHIFINNGIVDKENLNGLTIPGVDVLTLKEASDKFQSDVEAHFGKYADIEKDSFTALNTAFSHEGVFIKIHKMRKLRNP